MAETEYTKNTTLSSEVCPYYNKFSRDELYRTASPVLSIRDFNISAPIYMSDVAEQILHDESFNKQCKKNIENRNRLKGGTKNE